MRRLGPYRSPVSPIHGAAAANSICESPGSPSLPPQLLACSCHIWGHLKLLAHQAFSDTISSSTLSPSRIIVCSFSLCSSVSWGIRQSRVSLLTLLAFLRTWATLSLSQVLLMCGRRAGEEGCVPLRRSDESHTVSL